MTRKKKKQIFDYLRWLYFVLEGYNLVNKIKTNFNLSPDEALKIVKDWETNTKIGRLNVKRLKEEKDWYDRNK